MSTVPLSPRVSKVCENMLEYKKVRNASRVDEACFLGKPKYVAEFSHLEKAALAQVFSEPPTSGLEYCRFIVMDTVFHSQA